MEKLKRCTKCVLPETHETIIFDDKGVCNICNQQEYKNESINWDYNKKDFDDLIESYRGKYDYDCIVPFSGGKDSTWTLYYLVKKYNIKPLVVRFDHGFLRKKLNDNAQRTFKKLGVDVINFTPNWHVVRKLMLQSLIDKGDFCWHCHTGIFSYPMWIAIKYKVPLIIWGEPSSEYTSYYSYDQPEEVDEKRFNKYVNLGISADDMFFRLGGELDKRDLKPYMYPPLKDLKKINYRSVCMGSYIPWDVKKQTKIIEKELGWEGDEVENIPSEYSYEKIECHLQGVRDYLKYVKRGYTRPSHLATLDIRNNRLTREEGMRIVKEFEGRRPPSLDIFLDYVGITEHEFMEIAISHEVSPHKFDAEKITPGKKVHDFENWSRDGNMPRNEAIKQLNMSK
ncbi:N-acetyl sugar amidotransferase [Candidatus Woesearchaeota archaeon]|nr:N-acetyl sugar amidotransferase [Candidatus Woesearchaeota archaeon]